jgi:hypothetical protein
VSPPAGGPSCPGIGDTCAATADCCGGLACLAGKCEALACGRDVRLVEQSHALNPVRDLDILFVIDNSQSMQEEQDNLNRNFPTFMNVLKAIPGGMPNLHIGVVSSDLGAGPTPVGGCPRPGGDRGILQAKAGCMLDPNAKFMVSYNNGTMNNFQGDVSNVFACIANLGIAGCTFEHQLHAARLALYESITPENAGFLRRDAYLAIIFLTDEDDCSAAVDSDLFTQDIPDTTASFRCAHHGHTCGGTMPPAAPFMTPLATCRDADGGRLIRVQEIADSIKALKARPDQQILVSGIIGWPNNETGALYRYGGMPALDYLPICQAAGGTAAAGLRMKAFVDSFGPSGQIFTICQNDYRGALSRIGETLAVRFTTGCIAAPLVDTRPTEPGMQADCQVIERVPVPGGLREDRLAPCSASGPPCWSLEMDATCAQSGYRIAVNRAGAAIPPGTQQSVRCLTCTASSSCCFRP